MTRWLVAVAVSVIAISARAADWYVNAGAAMGRIEQAADGTLWLMVPLNTSTANVSGSSSSCTISQIHLLPPTGKEKEWLALAITAMAADKKISVYGDCIAASYTINATRLVIDYQ